jgi:hypothetical protein
MSTMKGPIPYLYSNPIQISLESIRAIESFIPIYPPHFPDIEAAKTYIASLCALDLSDPSKNKLAFLVACRAFNSGEFHLDTPLLNRRALRGVFDCCSQ